jgi:hypothetical protein
MTAGGGGMKFEKYFTPQTIHHLTVWHTFLLLSLIVMAVAGFNYFSTTTKVYVPDRRYKTGRRFSHSRQMTTSEIKEHKKSTRRLLLGALITGVLSLVFGLK